MVVEIDLMMALVGFLLVPGMKVYVTDEKELIMEPCLKWAANPNVTIGVKAFGLKATVQVVICCTGQRNYFIIKRYLFLRKGEF